jgi:hypothetical protein
MGERDWKYVNSCGGDIFGKAISWQTEEIGGYQHRSYGNGM